MQEIFNPKSNYQPIRLPGQQYDKNTYFHYNRYRYFETNQGSYINQDPIGFSGDINAYIYNIDPLIKTDPLGLFRVYAYKVPRTGETLYSFEFIGPDTRKSRNWISKLFKGVDKGTKAEDKINETRSAGDHDAGCPECAAACDKEYEEWFKINGFKPGGPTFGDNLTRQQALEFLWEIRRNSRPDINPPIIPGGSKCISEYPKPDELLDKADSRAIDLKGMARRVSGQSKK